MIGVADLRNRMADILNRVAYRGERIIIERRGKPTAAIVSIEDLELIEATEDAYWVKEAHKARAEMERTGEEGIPLEKLKAELGLGADEKSRNGRARR